MLRDIPLYHLEWFEELCDAIENDTVAIISAIDEKTGKPTTLIAIGYEGENGETQFIPIGSFIEEDEDFSVSTLSSRQEILH